MNVVSSAKKEVRASKYRCIKVEKEKKGFGVKSGHGSLTKSRTTNDWKELGGANQRGIGKKIVHSPRVCASNVCKSQDLPLPKRGEGGLELSVKGILLKTFAGASRKVLLSQKKDSLVEKSWRVNKKCGFQQEKVLKLQATTRKKGEKGKFSDERKGKP